MTKTRIRNLFILVLSVLFAFSIISFMATKTAKADAPVVIKSVAEVRMMEENSDGKNGIRFTGLVDEAYATPTEDKFAGIIIAREESVVSELTNEDPATLDVIDIKAQNFDRNKDDGALKGFNAVLYNIPESAYGTTLYARAYVCDAGVYQYSADVTAKSIGQVASEELAENNYEMDLEYETDILTAYVDGAAGTVSVDDIVLDTVTAKDVTLVGGDILEVTADKNLTPYISSTITTDYGTASVKVDGATLALKNNVKPITNYVTVKLGSAEYLMNVTTKSWYADITNPYVVADFEQEKSVYSLRSGVITPSAANPDVIVYTGDNGDYKYISAESEEGQAIGATSGVVKIPAGNYSETYYDLETPVKVSDLSGIYIKYKADADMEGNVYLKINEGVAKKITEEGYVSRSYKAGNGEWNTLTLSKYDLDYYGLLADTEISSIGFMIVKKDGTTYYLDEIGVLETPLEDWTDTELADGVYMDFDEENYVYSVETLSEVWNNTKNVGYAYHLSGDALVEELGENHGANGGVVKVQTFSSYSYMRLHFQKPIDRTKIAGITLRMRVPFTSSAELILALPGTSKQNRSYWIFNHANGGSDYRTSYGGIEIKSHAANEWIDVNLTLASMISNYWGDWTGVPEVLEYIDVKVNAASTLGAWYFDEVTVMNRAEDGYLIDFNEQIDLNQVNGHTAWWKGTADNPAFNIATGIGGEETTTALGLLSDCQNNFGIIPENTVNGKNVSKIIVRVFAPETEMSKANANMALAGFRLTVNSKTGIYTAGIHNFTGEIYTNTAALCGTVGGTNASCLTFERGKWVDVEVNVAGKLSDKNIDLIGFHRYSKADFKCEIPSDDGAWYIDSIRYVLADA